MSLTIYETDDTTPATGADFLSVDAGTSSSTYSFHIWWHKGVTSGDPMTRLYLRPRVAGAYSGHALLDQHAFEMMITGWDNPDSVPEFSPWYTGWTRVGTDHALECPPMYSNTALYISVRLSPLAQHSGTAASVAYDIVPVYNEAPPWETDADPHGILTGVGDGRTTGWVDALTVTETGTPDDKANVSARWWLYHGIPYRAAAEAVTLNQTDGDSATLGSGESYMAVLSQPYTGGTVTVTKGSKVASPDAPEWPELPAGELRICAVQVNYGAGGSVIETADIYISSTVVGGSRFRPYAGSGLELLVRPGQTANADQDYEQTVVLQASSTDYAWVLPGGTILVTTTDAQPMAGAIPLCEVVTDGSGVTAVNDRRLYAEPNVHLVRLAVGGTLTATTGKDYWVAPWKGAIDRVAVYLRAASIGATGSTDIDVNLNGTTIYGTKPSIAAQGTSDLDSFPTTTTFEAGDVLSFDVDGITSGGTTEIGCEVFLWTCKR